ncbi:MAG: hypothetical protein IT364_17145 [Candidatus Hydrogenedentes bacterium]|nr:hypothetical protein [Candidatus Hydrogenedentota bacterium]
MYRAILSTVMLSGAACLFAVGILGLRDDNSPAHPIRVRLDGSGERQVIRTENLATFPKPSSVPFDTRDTNGDGKVRLEEAQALEPSLTLQEFMDRDITGDGALTPGDFPSAGHAASSGPGSKSIPSVEG